MREHLQPAEEGNTEIPESQGQERTGKGTFQLGEVTCGRTSLCENAQGDG